MACPQEKETTTNYSEATMQLCGTALAPVFGGFRHLSSIRASTSSFMFNYQIGGQVYDSGYSSLCEQPRRRWPGNLHVDLYNAWTPENPNSNTPRFMYGDLQSAASSSRFLTNASYLSLENISLGYTLPNDWVKKLYLEKLRVYFACEMCGYGRSVRILTHASRLRRQQQHLQRSRTHYLRWFNWLHSN